MSIMIRRSADEYLDLLAHVEEVFEWQVSRDMEPVFSTDVDVELWELYLSGFSDSAERQHHNCHACRHFIERYGHLVTVNRDGRVTSAIWSADGAPERFRPSVAAMAEAVRSAKITGVFLSAEKTWGTPRTGIWNHFAIRPPAGMRFRCATQTPAQMMAEKRQDFYTIVRALADFGREHIETALTLLRSDSLYRSEKVLGQAQWLADLHAARAAIRGIARDNVTWRAVATAPAGFCHPRSSMIGTLLEVIAAGTSFEDAAGAFAAKMHPLAYQRPQAAPAPGAIAAAERIVQRLGADGALARRFARLEEVQALWRPSPRKTERVEGRGVFGHLEPKGSRAPAMRIPAQTMTWVKFEGNVLPVADRIEILAPSRGNYAALVTAVHADAPPILQWDREDVRNPMSWYVWNGGSSASQWGLRAAEFYDVSAVTVQPSMWGGGFEHQGKSVIFLIADARESRDAGAALFPEILRSEFHAIRSVIEAFSNDASIEGMHEPHAAGLMFSAGKYPWNATMRVWISGRSLEYRLDRWD